MRTLTSILLLFSFSVNAQPLPPSDLELRSAYCLSANKIWVKTFESSDKSGALDSRTGHLRDNIQRLEAYLRDKASNRNSNGLASAKRRAEIDSETAMGEISPCLRRCESSREAGQCVASCSRESGVKARLESCEKVDWLPY